MTPREQEFESVIVNTLEHLKELLAVKGKEYRRNNNPYHNFERGAEMTDLTREEVLQGFLRKHLISVEDMRNDSKNGGHQSVEKINEKYNDILVYFLIEKAMMLENAKLVLLNPKEKRKLFNWGDPSKLPGLSNNEILRESARLNLAELNKTNVFNRND